jgi:hypothetical protein
MVLTTATNGEPYINMEATRLMLPTNALRIWWVCIAKLDKSTAETTIIRSGDTIIMISFCKMLWDTGLGLLTDNNSYYNLYACKHQIIHHFIYNYLGLSMKRHHSFMLHQKAGVCSALHDSWRVSYVLWIEYVNCSCP